MKRVLKDYQAWVCTAVLVILHFSDTRYVTRAGYQADREKQDATLNDRLEKLTQSVTEVKGSIALLNKSEDVLKDHESRLRLVEKRNL